ncbi:hypothetical protein BDV18DRAFT_139787, partial [Aspergillus unguis]
MGQGLWCRPFSHPTQLYPNERHLKVDEENDRFRAWMGYRATSSVLVCRHCRYSSRKDCI